MSRQALALLLGAVALWFAGCGLKQGEKPVAKTEKGVGGVGVVDLDLVAKRLGRDIEMQNAVQERLSSLNARLATLQESLKRLYDEKKEKFGDDATDEELRELEATQERMDAQLRESKQKAQNELAAFRQALVDQFREQARPVLREVAAARGLSIIIPKNDGLLLTVDPAVEITDDVAAKMPAAISDADEKPQKPAAAKPKKTRTETSAR
jgi:Skp family chaperone for outer membrane proteins